jgi:hypothetical protein
MNAWNHRSDLPRGVEQRRHNEWGILRVCGVPVSSLSVLARVGRVVIVVTSELKDPELETALIRRIRMITFPASAVVIRTTLRQTFDFLPQ